MLTIFCVLLTSSFHLPLFFRSPSALGVQSSPENLPAALSVSDIRRSVAIMQELLPWERTQVGDIYDFDAMAKAVEEGLCSVYKEPLKHAS
jgi:hypothetical protein